MQKLLLNLDWLHHTKWAESKLDTVQIRERGESVLPGGANRAGGIEGNYLNGSAGRAHQMRIGKITQFQSVAASGQQGSVFVTSLLFPKASVRPAQTRKRLE